MLRCCYAEEDGDEIKLQPLGLPALSAVADQVTVTVPELLASDDDSAAPPTRPAATGLSQGRKLAAPPRDAPGEEKAEVGAGSPSPDLLKCGASEATDVTSAGSASPLRSISSDKVDAMLVPGFRIGSGKLQAVASEDTAVSSMASGEATSFTVDLTLGRNGCGLGVRLFVMPTCVAISHIGHGGVHEHNVRNPRCRVQVNDFIVAVNGTSVIKEMSQIFAARGAKVLSIVRCAPLHVHISRHRGTCGKVHALPGHSLVHLQCITKGSTFEKHNSKVLVEAPDQLLENDDCIASVNGVTGDALRMVQILQDPTAGALDLVILRPHGTARPVSD